MMNYNNIYDMYLCHHFLYFFLFRKIRCYNQSFPVRTPLYSVILFSEHGIVTNDMKEQFYFTNKIGHEIFLIQTSVSVPCSLLTREKNMENPIMYKFLEEFKSTYCKAESPEKMQMHTSFSSCINDCRNNSRSTSK